MRLPAAIFVLFASLTAAATPARAEPGCLSSAESHAAVASGLAEPFAAVRRHVEVSEGGEIIRARLCEIEGRLAYALTVLRRNGQVVGMTVDAQDPTRGAGGPHPRPFRNERREIAAPAQR
jgi:hypothetical protein